MSDFTVINDDPRFYTIQFEPGRRIINVLEYASTPTNFDYDYRPKPDRYDIPLPYVILVTENTYREPMCMFSTTPVVVGEATPLYAPYLYNIDPIMGLCCNHFVEQDEDALATAHRFWMSCFKGCLYYRPDEHAPPEAIAKGLYKDLSSGYHTVNYPALELLSPEEVMSWDWKSVGQTHYDDMYRDFALGKNWRPSDYD